MHSRISERRNFIEFFFGIKSIEHTQNLKWNLQVNEDLNKFSSRTEFLTEKKKLTGKTCLKRNGYSP